MPGKSYTTKGTASKPFLKPNVLHQYATYNTIFTLSGVTETELKTHKFLTNAPHDIIARTGGIGGDARVGTRAFQEAGTRSTIATRSNQREFNNTYSDSIGILSRRHDLFIENVNIISTVGPNAERNLGNFTRMEFEIHEPFGITFIEKVRAATAINGFVDYQDAPLLLTMEFKGMDEHGRPYTHHSTNKSHVRKIPILISRVDFDVNEGGARYTVAAVPYTDLAYDDRYKYPRTGMPIEGDDALEWARNAEIVLQDMMTQEIEDKVRTYADVYKFEIDPEVIARGGKYKNAGQSANSGGAVSSLDNFYDQDEEAAGNPNPKTGSAQASQGVSVTKFFEDAIRGSYGYQQLANDFWRTYLESVNYQSPDGVKNVFGSAQDVQAFMKSKEFENTLLQNQYVDWFKIKTSVETPEPDKIDPITKMSPKVIRYRAVPYRIHVLKFIAPGVSLANVDWGQLVHKEYDYIYTGNNVDVQNLRINYKTAYYLRNIRGDDKSRTEKGLFTDVAESFKKVFGREKDPEPLLPLRQYPSTIKGANTLQTLSGEADKAQQFYDYLTNPEVDMMRIEMEILGDPSYICQDIYVPIHEDGSTGYGNKGDVYDTASGGFNADQYQPIINVRYRLPDDIDENEGTMFSGDRMFRDERLFFNGLYQVNKIESSFNNGEFKQTLFCSRFNNQQGQGLPAYLADASASSIHDIQQDAIEEKVKEDIRRQREDVTDLGNAVP